MLNTLRVLFFIIFLPFILLYVVLISGFDTAYNEMKEREDNEDSDTE